MQQSLDQYSDQRMDDDKGRLDLSQQLGLAEDSFQQHNEPSSFARQGNDTQAEVAIMNMWTRMKSLEGKYIDLANFYKQELVSNSQSASALPGADTALSLGTSSNASKSAVSGVVNPASLSLHQQSSIEGRSSVPELNEDAIINDLKTEKIRFEQNFKSIIANGGLSLNQDALNGQFPSAVRSTSANEKVLSNEMLVRFNNELQGAFKDIIDHADQSQNLAIQDLANRQTQMFQLSTKYRMPSGFKNDAIGVFYDAKTSVTQILSQLKHFVQEKGDAIMAQSFTPSQDNLDDGRGLGKEDYYKLIERFEEDMVALKRGAKDYSKTLEKIKQSIKIHDESLKREQQAIRADYEDLTDAIANTNEILNGRKSLVGASLGGSVTGSQIDSKSNTQPRASGSGNRKTSGAGNASSPFDKRMSNYTQGVFNRSNSRGPNNMGQQKPPKLGMQNSMGRKPSAPGATSSPFGRKERQARQEQEYHPDLRMILNRLRAYDTTVAQLVSETIDRSDKVEAMVHRVDNQISNNLQQFLNTHDSDLVKNFFTNTVLTPTETAQIVAKANLNAHQAPKVNSQQFNSNKRASVSPYRGQKGMKEPQFGYRKSTPTRQNQRTIGTPNKEFGNSGKFAATGESMRLQELQTNTDQLFNELRRSNDKYIEQQVENRRLKDKVQVLQLQVEDLRIHNNRYQMKAQRDKSAGLGVRKTKTTRGTSSFGNEMVSPNRLAGYSAVSSGAYSQDRQDRDDAMAEEQELCKRIDQFFTAMKLLQRAVNRKEDISELKVEFETKQRGLQKLSKTIQARIKSQTSSAQLKRQPQDGSYERVSSNQNEPRTRSQNNRQVSGAPQIQGKQASASHRQPTSPLRAHQGPARPKTGKAGVQSPKPPFKESLPSSSRLAAEKVSSNADSNPSTVHQQAEMIASQRQQLEMLDQQLNIAKSQLSDHRGQSQQQRDIFERLIYNHKEGLNLIESEIHSQKQLMPHQLFVNLGRLIDSIRQDLGDKESQSIAQNPQASIQREVQEKLIQKIAGFEQAQLLKYQKLQKRLEEREGELDSVRKLFVTKLRELESNFAEIGDHIIANQQQTQEQAQKQQEQQLQLQAQASSTSQKEHVLVLDSREQDDKALEELIQTNTALSDEVDLLKKQMKEYLDPEESARLKSDLNQLDEQVRVLTKEKEQLVKMFGVLSSERDTAQEEARKAKSEKQITSVELSKQSQIAHALKLEKEEQEMKIQEQMKQIQIEINDEKEQKLCFQKEARDNEMHMKLMEEELEAMQNQFAMQEMERAQQKFELEETQEKLKTLTESAKDKVDQEEMTELTMKYDELELKHDVVVEQLAKQKDIEQEMSKVLSEVEADAQERQDKLSEAEKLLQQEKERLEGKEQELDQSQQLIQKLEEQIEDLQSDLNKVGKSANEQATQEQKEIQDLRDNIKKLQNEGLELEEKIKISELQKAEQAKLQQQELEEQAKKQQQALEEAAKLQEQLLEKDQAVQDQELALQEAVQSQEQALQEAKAQSERVNDLEEMQLKLQEDIAQEKEEMISEISNLKSTQDDLQLESVKSQRQNWWMTALQLKVKKIVMQQVEKERLANEQIKQDLLKKEQAIEESMKEKETLNVQLQKNQMQFEELKSQQESGAQQDSEKLESLNQDLINAQEEIQKKQNQISDFENQIKSLSEGNSQAEVLQKQLDQKHSELEEQQLKLKNIESQEQSLQAKLKEQEDQIKQIQKDKQDASKKAEERELMQASMFTEKQKETDELKKEADLLKQESDDLKKQHEEKLSIIDQLQEKLKEQVQQKEKDLEESAKNYEELQESSQQQLSKLEQDLKSALDSNNGVEDLQLELSKLRSSNDEALQNHQKEIEDLKTMQDLEMKELEQILKEQMTKLKEKETQFNDLELEHGALQSMIEKNKQEIQECKVKNEQEMQELTSKYEHKIEQQKVENQKVSDQLKEDTEKEKEQMKINQEKQLDQMEQVCEEQIDKLKETIEKERLQFTEKIDDLEDKLKKMDDKEKDYKDQIAKFEESEKSFKEKLEEAHKDMSTKVDSGHDNVKKIVDIHKTNEDLTQQLLDKVEQNKELEKKMKESQDKFEDLKKKKDELENDFANQKQAYEVLLDSMAGFESTETKLNEEIKELKAVIKDLEAKNENLMDQNKDMDDRIEELEKKGQGVTRNSIGSDGEEYSSVDEMKSHLKHARSILISYIQKLPYSAPENEATLPIIYSMLEFTKDEQEQLHKNRQEFNGVVEKINEKMKSNLKGKFTSLMKKKAKTDTQGSINSSGNNTNQSNK